MSEHASARRERERDEESGFAGSEAKRALSISHIMAHTAGKFKAFWRKKKQTGLGLMLLGALLLFSIFVFLSYSVLTFTGVPELLPAEETVFYGTFDVAQPEIRKYLIPFINQTFKINFEKDFVKKMQPRISFALIEKNNGSEKTLAPALIGESKEITSGVSYVTLGLDALSEGAENLAVHTPFLKIMQNIPQNSVGHFYVKESLLGSVGGYLMDAENGIFVSAQTASSSFSGSDERYAGQLLSLFPPNPSLFLGGQSFLENTPSSTRNKLASLVQGISEKELEEISRPFLSQEYGLATYQKNKFLFIGKNSAPQKLEEKLQKILAYENPDTEEVTLPDGSRGKELVVRPEKVERKEEKFGNSTVVIFEKPRASFEFAYATSDSTFFLSSDAELLKKSLEISQNPKKQNLKKTEVYTSLIAEVMRGSHEVAYLEKQKDYPAFALGLRNENDTVSLFALMEK